MADRLACHIQERARYRKSRRSAGGGQGIGCGAQQVTIILAHAPYDLVGRDGAAGKASRGRAPAVEIVLIANRRDAHQSARRLGAKSAEARPPVRAESEARLSRAGRSLPPPGTNCRKRRQSKLTT